MVFSLEIDQDKLQGPTLKQDLILFKGKTELILTLLAWVLNAFLKPLANAVIHLAVTRTTGTLLSFEIT